VGAAQSGDPATNDCNLHVVYPPVGRARPFEDRDAAALADPAGCLPAADLGGWNRYFSASSSSMRAVTRGSSGDTSLG
jgi:hypothetical protein